MENQVANTPKTPKIKAYGYIIFFCYIAFLITLLELTVRALELAEPYTPQPDTAIKLYYNNPNGLVLLRPNARYYTHGNIPMVINSEGYRDRLYKTKKDLHLLRIAAIGDSFTMGDGVYAKDSYPKQLESMLQNTKQQAEVINFGITATNTLQQLEFLRNKVLQYNPDIVILGFNLNDFKVNKETVFERSKRLYSIDYKIHADKTVSIIPPQKSLWESIMSQGYKFSSVWRCAHKAKSQILRWYRKDTPKSSEETYNTLNFQENVILKNYDIITNAIIKMHSLLKRRKIQFYIFIIPAMTEFDRRIVGTFDNYPFRNMHKRIGNFLKQSGAIHSDVLENFGNRKISKLVVSKFDPHFNRKGNSIIASAIVEFMQKQGVIH